MVEEYISLQEATKYCKYSQEYLSLRARQGKMKSVKFGQSWFTTRKWLKEYIMKAEEYNEKRKRGRAKSNETSVSAEKTLKKGNVVPFALPIEKKPVLLFGFVLILVFVLFITSWVLGGESFRYVFRSLSFLVQDLSGGFDVGFAILNSDIKIKKENFSDMIVDYTDDNSNVEDLFLEYGKWIVTVFKSNYFVFTDLAGKNTLQVWQKLENLVADLGEIFLRSISSTR